MNHHFFNIGKNVNCEILILKYTEYTLARVRYDYSRFNLCTYTYTYVI